MHDIAKRFDGRLLASITRWLRSKRSSGAGDSDDSGVLTADERRTIAYALHHVRMSDSARVALERVLHLDTARAESHAPELRAHSFDKLDVASLFIAARTLATNRMHAPLLQRAEFSVRATDHEAHVLFTFESGAGRGAYSVRLDRKSRILWQHDFGKIPARARSQLIAELAGSAVVDVADALRFALALMPHARWTTATLTAVPRLAYTFTNAWPTRHDVTVVVDAQTGIARAQLPAR